MTGSALRCAMIIRSRSRFIAVAMVAMLFAAEGWQWRMTKQRIRAKFPKVPQLSVNDLAEWLADPKRSPPLLIDSRTPEEFEVSHLADAVNGVPEKLEAERPIIVYCSVGYRSAEVAAALQKRGVKKVWNLEGSIFEWANSGREVVRDGKRVREVHPSNGLWGRMLRRDLHAKP